MMQWAQLCSVLYKVPWQVCILIGVTALDTLMLCVHLHLLQRIYDTFTYLLFIFLLVYLSVIILCVKMPSYIYYLIKPELCFTFETIVLFWMYTMKDVCKFFPSYVSCQTSIYELLHEPDGMWFSWLTF